MNALRSEWIKLATLNVNKVLLVLAVAFPIAITALTAALSDDVWDSADVTDLIGGLMLLSSLLFGVVAAIGITNEFNHGTIRPTFAAQPVRLKPLLAKLTVHLLVTAVLTVIILAASWALAKLLVEDARWDPRVVPIRAAILGTGLLAVGLTILGFGLGMLIRNTPAAVSFLLLWPLLAENLIRGLLAALGKDEWYKYLPYWEGLNMGFVDRESEEVMSRAGGGLYFFAWILVITVLGLWRTERADA